MMDITLYTTHCPKCKVLKSKMDAVELTYNICEDVEQMLSLGIQTAPALGINGEILDFGQAIKWLKENYN